LTRASVVPGEWTSARGWQTETLLPKLDEQPLSATEELDQGGFLAEVTPSGKRPFRGTYIERRRQRCERDL